MTSKEISLIVLKLHRSIRDQQWSDVLETLSQQTQEQEATPVYNSEKSIVPILLQESPIGWTAAHCIAILGSVDVVSWKWILTRIIEDYIDFLSKMNVLDNAGVYLEYQMNPFSRRTQAGHSPTDLFFSNRLHPSPWKKDSDSRRNSDQIKAGIDSILRLDDDHDVVNELRQRLQRKMDLEIERCEIEGMNSSRYENDIRNHENDENDVDLQRLNHLENGINDSWVLFLNTDVENSDDQKETALDEDTLVEIEKFLHDMELLLFYTFSIKKLANSIGSAEHRKIFSNWRIVHALAIVGCPREIGKLVIKLYPNQVRERDENGNLPIHLASSSHKTSSLADGTWHYVAVYGESNSSVPPMMKCLIEAYPEGVSEVDANGRFCINLALLAGKSWKEGVFELFSTSPHVVLNGMVDNDLGIPSFMIAALPTNASNQYQALSLQRDETTVIPARQKSSVWISMPDKSKVRASSGAKTGKSQKNQMQLTTIYKLLRVVPESIS